MKTETDFDAADHRAGAFMLRRIMEAEAAHVERWRARRRLLLLALACWGTACALVFFLWRHL